VVPTEPIAGRFVLVVDDVPPIARSIARALKDQRGLDAIAFTSSVDALAYCETRRPWLAVLDVRMPELDGVTLAMRLRAGDARIPIVFITGTPEDMDPEVIQRALGPSLHVISKPFAMATLLSVVDVLSGSDTTRG
jgi:two-component system OmpR family response regulator